MDIAISRCEPPVSIEAEQALLGAILVNNDCYDQAAELLVPDHFCDPLHQRIFSEMGTMMNAGHAVTAVPLHGKLKGFPGYEEIGGHEYLVNLTAAAVSILNVRSYAETIRELAIRRNLINVGTDLVSGAHDTAGNTPDTVGEEAATAIDHVLTGGRKEDTWQTMEQALSSALSAASDAQSGRVRAVPSGLSALDYMLAGGVRGGDLCIVAGRPGMGKTIMGATWAVNAAKAGYGVLFFSLEMEPVQIQHRVLSDALHRRGVHLPYEAIRSGKIPDERWRDIEAARGELLDLPIRWMDASGITAQGIHSAARARAREMARKGIPVGAVVIDYLGLIQPSGRYGGRKVDELGETTWALKTMARRMNVPVICLHQLSRAVEQREPPMPRLSDLRDSGNIEQDADSVLLLYRPYYYHDQRRPDPNDEEQMVIWEAKAEKLRHKFDVIVAKQRNGPTGPAHQFIDIPFAAIRDLGRVS